MGIFEFLKTQPGDVAVTERSVMYLRRVGSGDRFSHELGIYSTEKVEWVSRETDETGAPAEIRQPEEHTRTYSKWAAFSLAGKTYWNLKHFLRKQEGEWGEDAYGRTVFCTKERYPCFDSFDALYEDRYFRWYFIREGNSLSQLFVADDRNIIYVTEDLGNIQRWAWERMKATGFCQLPSEET